MKLLCYSPGEAVVITRCTVKCVDIRRNTSGGGGPLEFYWHCGPKAGGGFTGGKVRGDGKERKMLKKRGELVKGI